MVHSVAQPEMVLEAALPIAGQTMVALSLVLLHRAMAHSEETVVVLSEAAAALTPVFAAHLEAEAAMEPVHSVAVLLAAMAETTEEAILAAEDNSWKLMLLEIDSSWKDKEFQFKTKSIYPKKKGHSMRYGLSL